MSDSLGNTVVAPTQKSSAPSPPAVAIAVVPSAVKWLPKSAKHDYPAARSYLSLLMKKKQVDRLIGRLRSTKHVHFKAKDVLRAARLPLLPKDNPDVVKELARVNAGVLLSPCLIVRGRLAEGRAAEIADGYHRGRAANHVDEDSTIPVRIIDL